jgi:hypothetical protein
MHIAYFSKFPGSLIQLSRKIFHLWTLTNQDKKDNWHFMAFKSWFGDILFKHDTVERPYHIIQYICDNIHRTTYRYIISQLVKLQVLMEWLDKIIIFCMLHVWCSFHSYIWHSGAWSNDFFSRSIHLKQKRIYRTI